MPNSPVDEVLNAHRVVHRALLNAKSNRWRDIDITMQQLRAIYLLQDEGEVTVGRLAEMFDMGLPAASLLADRLVRAGLVERRADDSDRRRVLLSLTRAGDRLVAELREGSQVLLRRWLAALPAEDMAALSRGWQALAEVASRHGQPLERSPA
jgi:DNA-binding MarR family transcriptional regulator